MPECRYRTWVEISRSRLVANYRAICDLVGPQVTVMPVVKADAYRHGAVEVSRTLEQAGARWFAVSSVEEGVALRQAGIRARILVMADFLPFEREALLEFDLTPVIHRLEDLAAWERMAERYGRQLSFHLKLDTGMGRLGIREPAEAIIAALKRCPSLDFEGLMTHFASAAHYDTPQTEQQLARFKAVAEQLAAVGFRPRYQHLAATVPIAYGRKETWGNMVRPGQAIYGYISPVRGPAPAPLLKVEPVLTWKATVLDVKELPAGSPVGYGAMYWTTRPTRLGILTVGYGDGYPHRLSNRGRVIAAGRIVPVLGAVSMDLTAVDLTHAPEVRPGDAVTLLGREGRVSVDAHWIAKASGTISYNVLCSISSRVSRVYVD